MAGMEDITPTVIFQGLEEATEQLRHLGEVGAEAFARIIESASEGNFTGLATLLGGEVAGGFAQAAQAIGKFVDETESAVETLSNLATATGMSVPEIEGLKDAFASVGIETSGFERSVGRLAITIGNEWSQIQQSIRESADQQIGAMLHVEETTFGVQKAYHALNEAISESVREAAHSAIEIKQAAIGLEEAARNLDDFARKSQQNSLGIESASLSLKQAKLNLLKDQGFDTSADEQALKLQRDKLKVKEAEEHLVEANAKKAREAMELEKLQLDLVKARQQAEDANAKAIENSIKGSDRLKESQMAIQKAQLAASEAREKQYEIELKNIPAIAKEIDAIVSKTKTWDEVMNHADISAQSLTKAVILAASGGGKDPPQAMEVFKEMAGLFENMGTSADAMNKKMEIIQHTMGAGFRAGQASAAQLLAILERGPEALQAFKDASDKFQGSSLGLKPADIEAAKEYNAAWGSLGGILEQVKGHLAAIFSTSMTGFLKQMQESLTSTDGTLHNFFDGLSLIIHGLVEAGSGVARFVGFLATGAEKIAAFFDIKPAALWVGVIVTIAGILAPVPTAIIAIAAAFTYLYDHSDEILKVMKSDWDAFAAWFKSTWVGQVITSVGTAAGKIKDFFVQLWADVKTAAAVFVQWWDSTWIGKIVNGLTAAASKVKDFVSAAGSGKPQGAAGEQPNQHSSDAGSKDEVASNEKAAADKLDQSGEKLKEGATKVSGAGDAGTKAASATQQSAQALGTAVQTFASNTDGAVGKLADAAGALTQAAQALQESAKTKSPAGKAAGGGHIHGPGTGTSDQAGLFALSDGEYVVRSAAVNHYGPDLFESLNNLAVGGFAIGGMVGGVSTPRSGGTENTPPPSILNLAIDGNHFNGLKAPDAVASKLKSYAVSRQSSSAQKMPSWMR